jgi:hypothetical protein
MFMTGYHISIIGNPWRECTTSNCENQQNFASKVWFNLELGSSAIGHVRNLRPLKCMFMLGDHISATVNHWQECVVLNSEKQQKFTSKIWFNLEPGSGTTGNLGNLVLPQCIFMLDDHIPTTPNPWWERVVLNCENQWNFGSKIWLNLEPDSGAMGQLGNLMPPKCIFKLSDPISTTGNPWRECAVLNCENQQNFAPKIWFNLEPGSGATDHQGNPAPLKCMSMLGGHISTTVNPWEKCTALNCENWQNSASKMSLILELGKGTMSQLGSLMPPKCTFMLSDHISTTGNPWQE